MGTQDLGAAPLKVLIHGVSGRMGTAILNGIIQADDVDVVGGVRGKIGPESITVPGSECVVPIYTKLDKALSICSPDVLVDFTNSQVGFKAISTALSKQVHVITGTTGFTSDELTELDALANRFGVGLIVAPNFAIGAVLLASLAQIVGQHFNFVEIVESHHEAKLDSPSGTALAIADALVAGHQQPFSVASTEKETLPGTRGGDRNGVVIHSIRIPGLLARHEIILGTTGQTLTLRHDTINRECYVPGVLTAIRKISSYQGLVFGLEKVLGL